MRRKKPLLLEGKRMTSSCNVVRRYHFCLNYCRRQKVIFKVAHYQFSLQIDNFPALRPSARMAKPALGRGLGALLGGNPLVQPAPMPSIQPLVAGVSAPDNRERVQCVP